MSIPDPRHDRQSMQIKVFMSLGADNNCGPRHFSSAVVFNMSREPFYAATPATRRIPGEVIMKTARMLKKIVAASGALLALDALWLGVVMKDYYREKLAGLARGSGGTIEPDWTAAALVYVLLVTGILAFGARDDGGPAAGRVGRAAVRGALFGLVSYGIYDLTNMATLKGWTWSLSATDMAWGAFLCAVSAAAAAAAAK
jgi:uncharacterized membrane protein